MHKVWLIVHREYLERVRSKRFLFFTLLMPALMAGSILIPSKLAEIKSGTARRIVVVAANADLAAAVKQELLAPAPAEPSASSAEKAAPKDTFMVLVGNKPTAELHDTLNQQVSAGTIDGFLWLNDDDVANHKATYSARDVADFQTNAAVRSALRTALVKQSLAQKGMTGPQVESLLTPVVLKTVHITKGHEGASGMTVFLTGFIMVMLLYVNVLVYGISVMRSIIEEKNSRILEVLLSSVTAKELLAGKILGVGAVGLTQILIWLVIGALFSIPGILAAKAYLPNVHIAVSAIVWFGIFFLLGYFLYSTMYAALGAMVNSDHEAQQVQWVVFLPVLLSVLLASPVLQHPDSPMAIWLSLVPFFAPILMFIRVVGEQAPAWQLTLCLTLMLATIYGLLVLSSRIYRVGILMYGKRPTLPELRRWLKYAG
ncbi:MAG: ABC transporter permease [Anaerolineales bacterium]